MDGKMRKSLELKPKIDFWIPVLDVRAVGNTGNKYASEK